MVWLPKLYGYSPSKEQANASWWGVLDRHVWGVKRELMLVSSVFCQQRRFGKWPPGSVCQKSTFFNIFSFPAPPLPSPLSLDWPFFVPGTLPGLLLFMAQQILHCSLQHISTDRMEKFEILELRCDYQCDTEGGKWWCQLRKLLHLWRQWQ